MGNESCSFPGVAGKEFSVPQVKQRSSYGYTQEEPDDKVLKTVFSQSYDENRQSKVVQMIQTHRDQLFQDEKFKLSQGRSLRLSVLFNFQSNRTRIYSKKEQTDITSFIQLNIEFSYLTSVFYLLCRRQAKTKLLSRLIENQQTNNYGAYSTTLYCNGEKHNIIIDDRMPTHNDNFLFLRVVKGIQLWPLILQKAWCKAVGSYQHAKGLSPEDAFQEITGIPAYTYTIRSNNRATIKSILLSANRNNYWVALLARNGLTDLQNRQVFYLESIEMDLYTIISPYVSYTFEHYPQKRRGEVIVREQDILTHFQHVVVGFYKENYVPISAPISSKAREQLVFQLYIRKRQEVSIRFNQLYSGYFSNQDRPNYQYSPVLIQLYSISAQDGSKQTSKMINYCQGCNRSLTGTRSSNCSVNIMETLQGRYVVRVEVDWLFEGAVNRGNLVVYASEGNVQLTQLRNNDILFKQVYPDIFSHDGTNDIFLHQHNLEVHTFDKEKTTLIEFHNPTGQICHYQADFSKSKNVLLRGKEIVGDQVFIRLKPDEKTIIEVLPKDMKKHIEIENFEIHKIPLTV